jgi:hypothetical protein
MNIISLRKGVTPMYKSFRFLSLAFILLAVGSSLLIGQTLVQFKVPLCISSSAVPGRIDTLWCGVHGDGPNPPGAVIDNTYGTDVDLTTYGTWKEFANPPDPMDFTYIVKFIQIPFRTALPPDGIYASGLKPNDFRGYTSPTQTDTFQLNVYGDGTTSLISTATITIAWPAGLHTYGTKWELKKRVSGNNYTTVVADMGTVAGSYTDDNTAGSNSVRYLVIKSGAVQPPPPMLNVSPADLPLGNVSSNSTTRTLTVINPDESNAVTISAISAPLGFTVTPAPPIIIPKQGGTATLTVTFDATTLAAGTYAGNIIITSDAAGSPVINVPASATVIAPEIALTPAAIDFGKTSYPQVKTQSVTLANISPLRSLHITSLTSTNSAFTFSPSAPLTIAPGGSQVLNVTFTTQVSGGTQTGTLLLGGDDTAMLAMSGISQVQGGVLMFDAQAISVLDNSYNSDGDANGGKTVDGYYTATIGLHEYSGLPIKNFQFTLKTNGKINMHPLKKTSRVAGWSLSTKVVPGPVLPDGSSIDSINVLLWALGADTLDTTGIATAPIPLLTFGYDVVNISTDNDSTSIELKQILSSTNIFTDAQLNTYAVEAITIHNRINRGDINKDDRVDILDLLMIVDHITGKTPLTGDAFKSADVAPWPNGDGMVNVMDLAQLQNIILNNQYPDGSPLLQIAHSAVKSGLAKASIDLIFHVSTKEIAIELNNTTLFRGVQVKFTGIQSAATSNSADLTGTAYSFKDSILTVIIKQAEPLPAGNYIIARVPVNCRPVDVETVPGIVVAGDDLKPATFDESIINGGTLVDDEFNLAPKEFNLGQNYPNPFNPTTKIKYEVKALSQVRIALYNMLGQEVAVLVNSKLPAGRYAIEWNGMDSNRRTLATGTYIYRMTAGNFVETKKMMFVK